MDSNECPDCGGNLEIAKIARKMGHRPDVAFARVNQLERLLKNISIDLLERADIDSDGKKVVNLGNANWLKLKDAINGR